MKAATFENGTSYILSNSSGTVVIYDPDTSTEIAQADASDGSGSGYDLPAILWIAMSFVLGVPLLLGGVRLGRITSGIGMGVGLSVAGRCYLFSAANYFIDLERIINSMGINY